ncbi:SMC5-SMC6 complex localization factor protein 2 isoform X4 [Solea solea]|uniref:SMC5-SMC6 complex localization factor protein 2 isoform X4 n=1 Tax=Solea solea TaxID=90069 RepID=UPI00272A3737|nr:SMC5-SMC6 complex localization factor protein 2 isoform X4 [Solea solea]
MYIPNHWLCIVNCILNTHLQVKMFQSWFVNYPVTESYLKGEVLALQHHSLHQETPMKPPHIPNEPYHPPPRRKLPLQSPELCHRSEHLTISLEPICIMDSPANIGTPALLSSHCSRERLCATRNSGQHPGPFYSSHNVPFNQSNIRASVDGQQSRPPTDFHYISPKCMRDVSNYSTSSFHMRRDQVTKPKDTLCFSGSKNVTAINQDSNKHRPHVSPPERAAEEVYPQQPSYCEPQSPGNCHCPPSYCKYPLSRRSSDRRSDVGVPMMHSPARPDQDQQYKRVPSSVKSTPAEDSHCSSLKRRRDSEDNSTSPSLVSSLKCSSDFKLQQKTTDSHLCTEPVCGQSSHLVDTDAQDDDSKHYIRKAYITSSQDQIIKIRLSEMPADGCLRKTEVEPVRKTKCSTLFSPKVTSSLPHTHSTSVLQVKTPRTKMSIASKSSSKLNSGSQVELNKTGRLRRHGVMPNYTDYLFTPDPISYLVSPAHKTAKPERAGSTIKSTMPEKSCSSTTSVRSSTRVTGSSCQKTQNSTVRGFTNAEDTKVPYSVGNIQFQLPSVTLERIKLENIPSRSKDSEPITISGRQLQGTSVKSEEEHTTLLAHNVTSVTGTTASKEMFHFTEVKKETGERNGKKTNEEDSADIESVELDLDFSFELDVGLAQSSQSSEEEQLLSLQEMIESVTKPPDTPEKGAFSEPSTPGNHSMRLRARLSSPTKPGLYKNNLDLLLKEINTNKKAKKSEEQLLLMCKEDLLRIAKFEEDQEQQEEAITSEQQEFVQRYTLMSDGLREVPPGEAVFNLEKFGQIFNQDTLQLRKYMVKPQGMAQKTLLWSSPAQLRSHVTMGLFQEAYDCQSPCPTQVSRFLFKMMSVHTERLISEKILEVLRDIACTAACQIVESESQQFKVWVPSLADVTLVLLNMGVPFVSLFPFENLQPQFTEGDLLEDVYIYKSESPSHNKEQKTVPEHNYSTILKYLSLCMGLCPRAYSDDELLLLLSVLERVSLDTQLILQPSVEIFPLLYKILNNFRDWKSMLPRICLALTDLTDDHHNMCLLIQQLPDNKRGKQLRQHLSLSMISKLLNGKSTYRPTEEEFQLSALRPYLPAMQPSTIIQGMLSSSSRSWRDKDEDMAYLDQQSYYLCYSLLTLTNEASNFQSFPAHQNDQLLCLYSDLDVHVKCDIRESEKCLYRSKVKDLVSRIDIKWQNMLQKTKPFYSWSAV